MLGTLRDQYSAARITLPTDLPLNWWLRERQVPHRLVDHPAAHCQGITRMQARVNNVPTFVSALRPLTSVSGIINLGVDKATYRIELAEQLGITPAGSSKPARRIRPSASTAM